MFYYIIVSVLLWLPFLWLGRRALRPPAGRAEQMLARGRPVGTVVACLGDSITHGHVSDDWVSRLRDKLAARDIHLVNEGINGNVVWQLGQRLLPALECNPDIAVVLIGTNDVMGTFHGPDGELYQRDGKLPEVPSRGFYRRELRALLERLQAIPRRAICTLPPLGEDPKSPINQLVASFNEDIQELAKELEFDILPLNARLHELLESRSMPPARDYLPGKKRILPMMGAVASFYLLRRSWDEIAARRGLVMTPDYIHLGERAGRILEELVEDFILA